MAVIVLGAGATRGASFVDPKVNPCLPPLDSDFYSQLQRVRDPKHRVTIDQVIEDTVELFGVNFKVTAETMFTTLEHTSRMVETTGENRDYRRADLNEKRKRLQQAIAAVLEESICRDGRTPTACEFHEDLVSMLRPSDRIISFNYDCVVDHALRTRGNGKWDAHYGYGFALTGRGGRNLTGDAYWSPTKPAGKKTIKLLKLHGSLHFVVTKDDTPRPTVHLKERPYTRQNGDLRFTIIPPESRKRYDTGVFSKMWKSAGDEIHRARTLVVIGYSLPPTDMHSTALFRISTRREWLRSLVIVNPDPDARRRTRDVLQRGMSRETRVVVFDSLAEFVAADRKVWER